ncbi:MAG: hypothetical protein K8E24_014075, partial [Methanobacterium paludis]|nr:hypothetical protein [Methanobacterium paludis]
MQYYVSITNKFFDQKVRIYHLRNFTHTVKSVIYRVAQMSQTVESVIYRVLNIRPSMVSGKLILNYSSFLSGLIIIIH